MENTSGVIFKDTAAKWYIAFGSQWVGPLKSSEVYVRLQSGSLSPAHFILQKGQKTWKRIVDESEFQSMFPSQPSKDILEEILESQVEKKSSPPLPIEEAKKWFLYFEDSQFGPFNEEEVRRSVENGKVTKDAMAWTDGMLDWEPLSELTGFRDTRKAPPSKPVAPSKKEKRSAARKPLVARIVIANKDQVLLGVCRDISVGGMQVLTDQIPGDIGTTLKINISPPSGLKPFVAEGEIVRILEDGRGFSFRFQKLGDAAKKAIQSYIGK